MLFLVIMFACVYFKKDGTLSVVHKNDKDLKVLTDSETREQVEMFNMVGWLVVLGLTAL